MPPRLCFLKLPETILLLIRIKTLDRSIEFFPKTIYEMILFLLRKKILDTPIELKVIWGR